MAEWSTITDVAEVVDSISETTTTTGKTGSVVLTCPWSQRFAVRDDLILTSRIWPYDNPTNLLSLRATSCVINPNGVSGAPDPASPQLHVYEKALLNVGYETVQAPDPTSLSSPYTAFQETITPSIDWIRLDHTLFRWASGGNLAEVRRDEAPALPIGRLAFERTYFNWSGAFPSEYLDATATTNSDTVTSVMLGRTFPPGTLIYQPGTANQSVSSDGSRSATLSVRFLYKREGWNRWYNAELMNVAEFVVVDGTRPTTDWQTFRPFTPTAYAGLFA